MNIILWNIKFIDNQNNNSINYIYNIFPHKIIDDAYCSTETENSFIVINSINGDSFIIYTTSNKSIISYNLSKKRIDKENKTAHSSYISSLQYYFEKYNNQEIIMSLSYLDNNLKIWTFKNWQCLINAKNFYSFGYLYSANIFNYKKKDYFIISNFANNNSDYIHRLKVYNFKGRQYKLNQTINDSNYNTLLVKTFMYQNKLFIVSCGDEIIRSYNFDRNELYKKYDDNIKMNCKIFSFIIFNKEEKVRIISSCDDKNIRTWNFIIGELLNKIEIDCFKLRGINLYDEKYLLVGCGDNTIKLVDLENSLILKSVEGHVKKVTTIKIENIKNIGKCIFSHGYDDKIILWK